MISYWLLVLMVSRSITTPTKGVLLFMVFSLDEYHTQNLTGTRVKHKRTRKYTLKEPIKITIRENSFLKRIISSQNMQTNGENGEGFSR